MFLKPFCRTLFVTTAMVLAAGQAAAFGITDILTAPITLIEHAVEARTVGDIATDKKIGAKIAGLMVKYTSLGAASEVYEQRVLLTGIFDDMEVYAGFKKEVAQIADIKKTYWHVIYMSEADQKKNDAKLIDWDDALIRTKKIGAKLLGAKGIASTNFHAVTDAYGTVYLIGRAMTKEEMNKVLAVARDTEGVKKITNYMEVRPE